MAGGLKERTFIETQRRAQIVAAAIDTIAELGYAQASLSRIAARAGTSKGVICYHFAGKDDLFKALVAGVVAEAEAYMRPLISAESTGRAMLRAYLQANLALMGDHRNHLMAVAEIARNARDADGNPPFDSSFVRSAAGVLQQLLAHFQANGQFRADFDPMVMACAIRAAIDSVPARLAREPELDLTHYGQELADLFDRATRPAGDDHDADG